MKMKNFLNNCISWKSLQFKILPQKRLHSSNTAIVIAVLGVWKSTRAVAPRNNPVIPLVRNTFVNTSTIPEYMFSLAMVPLASDPL